MELKTFAEKIVDIELDWFGETIAVGIRPGIWTQDLVNALMFYTPAPEPADMTLTQLQVELDEAGIEYPESAKKGALVKLMPPNPADARVQALLDCIAYWDITEDGQMWPVTLANLNKLPPMFLAAIPNALAKKIRDEGKT